MFVYGFEISLGFMPLDEFPTVFPYSTEAASLTSAFRNLKRDLPEYFRQVVSVCRFTPNNIEEFT